MFAALNTLADPIRAELPQGQDGFRLGVFVGARVQLSLGGHRRLAPRGGLAIAPTRSRFSTNEMVGPRIGEGVALNFMSSSRPAITVAGIRAADVFDLPGRSQVDEDTKVGISTGGWLAIGLGLTAVIGGAYLLHLANEAEENSD